MLTFNVIVAEEVSGRFADFVVFGKPDVFEQVA